MKPIDLERLKENLQKGDRLPEMSDYRVGPDGMLYHRDEPGIGVIPMRFEAPLFALDRKRHNHAGMGYHVHLLQYNAGKYRRCGYIFTLNDGIVFAVEHGEDGRPSFQMEERLSSVRRNVQDETREMFRKIPDHEFLPAGTPRWELFRKDW